MACVRVNARMNGPTCDDLGAELDARVSALYQLLAHAGDDAAHGRLRGRQATEGSGIAAATCAPGAPTAFFLC
jgi:hypothetical protein